MCEVGISPHSARVRSFHRTASVASTAPCTWGRGSGPEGHIGYTRIYVVYFGTVHFPVDGDYGIFVAARRPVAVLRIRSRNCAHLSFVRQRPAAPALHSESASRLYRRVSPAGPRIGARFPGARCPGGHVVEAGVFSTLRLPAGRRRRFCSQGQ